ncbi:MAG TPA: helix-turn-helix domain-containing protein [Thermoanaerobaculia bacterium]|nr:helix-turn-helix domain-containing protein [Thermoanaerobaculia bacterium]
MNVFISSVTGYDESMTDGDVSVALTVLRVVRGWNQDDLAKASGVRNSAVSDYERGRKVPGLKTLIRLVSSMGYPLSAIDHVMSFIGALRSGAVATDAASAPPALGIHEGGQADSPANAVAFQWEVEQVSAEIGRAVSRMTRLIFASLGRSQRQQPEAGVGERTASAPGSIEPGRESGAVRA